MLLLSCSLSILLLALLDPLVFIRLLSLLFPSLYTLNTYFKLSLLAEFLELKNESIFDKFLPVFPQSLDDALFVNGY